MFRLLITAIRFIVYDKPKSIGALLGVVISIFLIGQQAGIFIFLTNAMSRLVDHIEADVWIVDDRTTNVNALGQIDARVLREIQGMKGVAGAYPLVIAGSSAKTLSGKSAGVSLVGCQAPSFVGGPWNIAQGRLEDLVRDGAVSVEFFDQKLLGNIPFGEALEIGGKKVYVALETKGVRGFGASYVFTTIERARYLAQFPSNKLSAVLVRLKDPASARAFTEEINGSMYGLRAWTREDFSKATVSTVLGSSGIALSVGTLIIFAIISGSVIIGLTLYSAATDRIRDYATLKAIGATNLFVMKLILCQAMIFAITGYGIGLLMINGFKNGIAKAGTIFDYSPALYLGFLLITLFISLIGAVAAIRRITRVEPAAVFRG
jgi:putative ABC transport system permease protein